MLTAGRGGGLPVSPNVHVSLDPNVSPGRVELGGGELAQGDGRVDVHGGGPGGDGDAAWSWVTLEDAQLVTGGVSGFWTLGGHLRRHHGVALPSAMGLNTFYRAELGSAILTPELHSTVLNVNIKIGFRSKFLLAF